MESFENKKYAFELLDNIVLNVPLEEIIKTREEIINSSSSESDISDLENV